MAQDNLDLLFSKLMEETLLKAKVDDKPKIDSVAFKNQCERSAKSLKIQYDALLGYFSEHHAFVLLTELLKMGGNKQ